MKKTLLTILIVFLSFSAYADGKINVLKHSRPGGLIDRMNEVLALSLGDDFGKFISFGNCAQAKKALANTAEQTLTIWPTEREYGDQPCNLDDSFFISTFSNSPYHITYFKDNTKASDINHLLTGEITVGVWDSAFWSAPQTAFLQALNPNIKVVRYKSKPFRTALPSGEIDYKVVSFPGEDPVIAVLGANDYKAITGNELLPGHPFADMGYSFLLVGNLDYDVSLIFKSDAWNKRKDVTHKPWMRGLSKDQQISAVNEMLEQLGSGSN
jgi:hypothetical protein